MAETKETGLNLVTEMGKEVPHKSQQGDKEGWRKKWRKTTQKKKKKENHNTCLGVLTQIMRHLDKLEINYITRTSTTIPATTVPA